MYFLILSSLLTGALSAPASAHDVEGIKFPIPKRASLTRDTGVVDPAWYFGLMQWTIQRYEKGFTLPFDVSDVVKRESTTNEPLADEVSDGTDELYYGPLMVGAETPQSFGCDFDTGSADLFVPGPNCGTAQGCTGTTKYNQGGMDEGNTTTITYGSGQVTGENYFDDVDVAGLRAEHTNVISLTKAQGFAGSLASSLMGMAFSTIAESKQPTYFENLIAQDVVSTPEFSFYLGRAADGTGSNSQLTLGGRDSSKFTGQVTQVPVSSQTYWQVALGGVLVNGKEGGLLGTGLGDPTPGQAAIDTGTTLIIAPTGAADSIYSRIPGSIFAPVYEGGPIVFAYPCSANPNVQIMFGGRKFAIDPRDFTFGTLTANFATFMGNETLAKQVSGNYYCLGSILGYDLYPPQSFYVVGDTFLKNWYSIFNYVNAEGKPSVSFAKSI